MFDGDSCKCILFYTLIIYSTLLKNRKPSARKTTKPLNSFEFQTPRKNSNNARMSAAAKRGTRKKVAAKKSSSKGPTTIFLICKAIGAIRLGGSKGVSRQAIANYLIANNGKTAGGNFNANLRRALKSGIAGKIIRFGDTEQRYKLAANAKAITNPPKKGAIKKKKKKKVSRKKKASKKKKLSKKKKVSKKKVSKKKKVTKKKKPASKKRKAAPKKKSSSKKKTPSKKRRSRK